MYNENVKRTARRMYLYEGMNPEQIARELKAQFPTVKKLDSNTVRSWAKTMDWEADRTSIERMTLKKIQEQTVSRKVEIQKKALTITDMIYNKLVNDLSLKAGSFEGLVYAMKAMADFEMKLDKEDRDKKMIHPGKVIEIILSVFQSDDEVAKAIRRNWNNLGTRIQHELKALMSPEGDEVA